MCKHNGKRGRCANSCAQRPSGAQRDAKTRERARSWSYPGADDFDNESGFYSHGGDDRPRTPPPRPSQTRGSIFYPTLGIAYPFTADGLKEAYRAATRKHHPDLGGEHMAMVRVNQEYAKARALIS